jgi:hypothetical protein
MSSISAILALSFSASVRRWCMIIGMPRDTSEHTDRAYMDKICSELQVHRSTVITWERNGWLPEGLEFQRDESAWRYWTLEQLERARAWHNRSGKRRSPRLSAT